MKPLKLILAAVLGLVISMSGYSAEQKKEKQRKVRQIWISGLVTDINGNPLPGVAFLVTQNGILGGTVTQNDGTYYFNCNNNDTIRTHYEGYISKIIPVNDREEINVVLEKIPEDLLPAKDSTEKK